jgi:hypothetical protein
MMIKQFPGVNCFSLRGVTATVLSCAFLIAASAAHAQPTGLKEGQAVGSISHKGKTANLAYAYVLRDNATNPKVVSLYITDKPLPADVLNDSMKFMVYSMDHKGSSSIEYALDPSNGLKERSTPNICVECQFATSTNLIEIKFDPPPGKVLAGTVRIKAPDHAIVKESKMSADVKFYAVAK